MAGYIGLTRESFDKLDQALGKIDNIGSYVESWMDENAAQYIESYISQHGLAVSTTVTDGDLEISIA